MLFVICCFYSIYCYGGGDERIGYCKKLKFWVDIPLWVPLPNLEDKLPDGYVVTFKASDGKVRGYVANGSTYILEGLQADQLSLYSSTPVLSPPANVAGTWLQAVQPVSGTNQVWGWYHQESPYTDFNKSVRYVQSIDGGRTFNAANSTPVINFSGWDQLGCGEKLDPVTHRPSENGVVVPCTDGCPQHVRTWNNQGDHSVVKWVWANFTYGYYMYFMNAANQSPHTGTPDEAWLTSVARMETNNSPTSWKKYIYPGFSNNGIGGEATKIGLCGTSASVYDNYGSNSSRLLMLLNHETKYPSWGKGGIYMYFTDNPNDPYNSSLSNHNFFALQEPLLYSDINSWVRGEESGNHMELIAYPSVSHLDGGNHWTSHFVLFSLYLPPDANYSRRYLIRRHVWIQERATAIEGDEKQVLVRLARYKNSTQKDWWSTTSYPVHLEDNTPSNLEDNNFTITNGYVYDSVHPVYYVMTKSDEPSTRRLVECVSDWPGHLDHMVTDTAYNDETAGVCGGYRKNRTLGWIYTQEPSSVSTTPLYRCYDPVDMNHFVSTEQNCEGKTLEWRLGYAPRN